MIVSLKCLAILVVGLAVGVVSALRADDRLSRSNAEIIGELCRGTAEKFCNDAAIPESSSVSLDFGRSGTEAYLAPHIVGVLRSRFTELSMKRGASAFEITATGEAFVAYGEPFSEGLFSARRSARTVKVSILFSLVRNGDGKVIMSAMDSLSRTDTISVAEIHNLERGTEGLSPGEPPAPSFIEKFLEPVIIGGAAGVAVYLFFTIRS